MENNFDLSKYNILEEHTVLQDGIEKKIYVVSIQKTPEYIKKANRKYVEENKEELNKKKIEKYHERYYNDEEYRQKMLERRREYYRKNKK